MGSNSLPNSLPHGELFRIIPAPVLKSLTKPWSLLCGGGEGGTRRGCIGQGLRVTLYGSHSGFVIATLAGLCPDRYSQDPGWLISARVSATRPCSRPVSGQEVGEVLASCLE